MFCYVLVGYYNRNTCTPTINVYNATTAQSIQSIRYRSRDSGNLHFENRMGKILDGLQWPWYSQTSDGLIWVIQKLGFSGFLQNFSKERKILQRMMKKTQKTSSEWQFCGQKQLKWPLFTNMVSRKAFQNTGVKHVHRFAKHPCWSKFYVSMHISLYIVVRHRQVLTLCTTAHCMPELNIPSKLYQHLDKQEPSGLFL